MIGATVLALLGLIWFFFGPVAAIIVAAVGAVFVGVALLEERAHARKQRNKGTS